MSAPTDDQVKIDIPLLGTARESGFEIESVWAEPLGDNLYRIWNLPVFAFNLDMRAIVECSDPSDGGRPLAIRLVEPGDCYVVRLFFDPSVEDEVIDQVLDLMSARRALFEKYNRNLWAVGLRTREDYEWLGDALESYVRNGVLNFESGFQPDEPKLGDV